MLFTIVPVLSGSVYLICQYTVRIITCALLEAFHRFYQAGALVVCFERYFFDASISFTVKTQIKFCTKFNRGFYFPSDNRTKPRLRDAYNTMFHWVYFVIVHVLLLFIQRDDSQIQTNFFFCHRISVTHELLQIPDVSCDVTKLFAECLPDFLCTMFFTFGKCQIIFSGTFFITPWQWQTIRFAKTINDRFQFFPCFIQEWNILGITDICRCTGCIQC